MKRKRAKQPAATPVRAALSPASSLQARVEDGLGAMENDHHGYIEKSLRAEFADSLNLDEAMGAGHAQENRWDYLLGHGPTTAVVALEPHSARQDEVSTVIAKRTAARDQLRPHLKPNARIAAWLWVASGRVHFADTEKARLRLDQNGIQFVGKRLLRKHLPVCTSGASG
jgi:hypothetical protein